MASLTCERRVFESRTACSCDSRVDSYSFVLPVHVIACALSLVHAQEHFLIKPQTKPSSSPASLYCATGVISSHYFAGLAGVCIEGTSSVGVCRKWHCAATKVPCGVNAQFPVSYSHLHCLDYLAAGNSGQIIKLEVLIYVKGPQSTGSTHTHHRMHRWSRQQRSYCHFSHVSACYLFISPLALEEFSESHVVCPCQGVAPFSKEIP